MNRLRRPQSIDAHEPHRPSRLPLAAPVLTHAQVEGSAYLGGALPSQQGYRMADVLALGSSEQRSSPTSAGAGGAGAVIQRAEEEGDQDPFSGDENAATWDTSASEGRDLNEVSVS